MSSIGFMGVGLCGLRNSILVDPWLLGLGSCKVPVPQLSSVEIGLGRTEENGWFRP